MAFQYVFEALWMKIYQFFHAFVGRDDDILLRNWALTMMFELFKMAVCLGVRYINREEILRFCHKWIGFISDSRHPNASID
ncbi:hypothetical protein EUGRSUZ_K01494 [Eucalyptus grandis]|uniref:Uncharacterized protein n=2 Tax=Eucalyptus grandis TaxID=71139 RepID=A0ACC3ITI3_EUCGR|nr:hypothetical protein EUGRSUZ_K01494 [Eucalyptus grandis]